MTTEAGIRAKESIFRILLSAGYFRVRMSDIDDFDKIAGGLAWALKASSVDVDIDIFFKEKPNIGEKVRISDSICQGLISAKCPYNLVPHQIQGLDFPQLYPVFQWLVKNVIETRSQLGDFQRSFAEYTFKSHYSLLPSDISIQQNSGLVSANVRQISKSFPPKRFYKRNAWDSNISEVKQLETTLLEYGRIPTLITAQAAKPAPGGKQAAAAAQKAADQQDKRNEELRATLSSMKRETDESSTVDGSVITSFVSAQSKDILAAQSIFDESNKVDVSEEDLKSTHNQQMAQLTAHLSTISDELKKVSSVHNDKSKNLDEAKNELLAEQQKNSELKNSIQKAQAAIEASGRAETLAKAVSIRDDNMRDVEAFQKQCKEDLKEWKERIENLKAKNSQDNDANMSRLSSTLEQYEHEWERKQELVAEKARELLKLRMQYDQYPTMVELTQYERRMTELSALSLQKHTDFKKCRQLLNSLISSGEILERENELFNSVLKSFNQAINDQATQRSLVDQLAGISKQTQANKDQMKQSLEKQMDAMAKGDKEHRDLLEKQRKYFQTLKQFQEASDILDELTQ